MDDEWVQLFVPGRVCLLGEHSDWAGSFRRFNSDVVEGMCLVCGTEQGLYARVRRRPDQLVMVSLDADGTAQRLEQALDPAALLARAREGGFWSYACGVAYQLLLNAHVGGIEIVNFKNDLPLKKGLSSSAAYCVLVARAFNRLYDLKLTVRGEMDLAYKGEITTPSRCGRMDQCCAFGKVPVLMTFDGEDVHTKEVKVGGSFHFVIVDLKAEKDTMEILSSLSRAYPKPTSPIEEKVHEFLGPLNKQLLAQAQQALEDGDAARLGGLLTRFQALFDEHLIPQCPSQLTSPVLHRTINHPSLQPLIHGAKGIGSQGDGSAQFLCLSKADQQRVCEIVEQDLGMAALKLTIGGGAPRVLKAVVPCAGSGSGHMYPATKCTKAPLLPVLDVDGIMKPAVVMIVEEALNVAQEVLLVVRPEDEEDFRTVFHADLPTDALHALPLPQQEYAQRLSAMGRQVALLVQPPPQVSLSAALLCAQPAVGGDPFLLLLGDHIYQSFSGSESCVEQLMQHWTSARPRPLVALRPTPITELHRFGCVAGVVCAGRGAEPEADETASAAATTTSSSSSTTAAPKPHLPPVEAAVPAPVESPPPSPCPPIEAGAAGAASTTTVPDVPPSPPPPPAVASLAAANNTVVDVHAFKEKPTRAYARDHLRVVPRAAAAVAPGAVPALRKVGSSSALSGLSAAAGPPPAGDGEEMYLTVFGQYVLPPTIFEHLRAPGTGGQCRHFTEALESLRRAEGFYGVVPQGLRFDVGDPLSYVNTLNHFKEHQQERMAEE